ncbi:MAG: single-stranded DNA-binding protein [Candidatus Brocadiia bacterium]
MANFNKVFLMGNLTRDPELRYTPSGTSLCEFGMATNRTWTNRDGEQREEACFVDITMWGRRGEVISEYFSKGDPIFIEGRLKLDQWETADGRRSKLTVVAENFEFIGGRGPSGGSSRGKSQGGGSGQPKKQPPKKQQQKQQKPDQEPAEDVGFDVSDDEIPF